MYKIIKRKVNSAGLRLIEKLEKTFKRWPDQFCLITGAPRSGTTALEKWLHEQQKTVALHETRGLIAIHKYIEEMSRHYTLKHDGKYIAMARKLVFDFYNNRSVLTGKDLIIDKEPLEPIGFPNKDYASFLQNFRLLFPNGKLIFMIRDPLAAIWSMQERKWGYSLKNYTPHSFPIDTHIENWCECADLILKYEDDSGSYVCSFERLVDNPDSESKRIFDFLELSGGKSFQPRPVKTIQFDEEQRVYIEKKTKPQIEKLSERGLI